MDLRIRRVLNGLLVLGEIENERVSLLWIKFCIE